MQREIMASRTLFANFVVLCLVSFSAFRTPGVEAADPEEIIDYAPPPNGTVLDGNYFTSRKLRNIVVEDGQFVNITGVNVNAFPVLSGLGVSNALLTFPPGSVNVPHVHPRGTETLFVVEGSLHVGLIDTSAPVPNLFKQTLEKDDIFVFPRGLVHYQINKSNRTVRAYASFSSTNPGLAALPLTLFGVHIDLDVLTKSFQVPPNIIYALSAHQP